MSQRSSQQPSQLFSPPAHQRRQGRPGAQAERLERQLRDLSSRDGTFAARGAALFNAMMAEREQELSRYESVEIPEEHDDVVDSPSPMYDTFLGLDGGRTIKALTNFVPAEFDRLWELIAVEVTAAWRKHRGHRSRNPPKDVFFMTLSVFKGGMRWTPMASIFDIKAPTFQRMIVKFVRLVSPILYESLVAQQQFVWPMDRMNNSGRAFENYPCARYATDVTFQQTNIPSINPDKYYSAKHKLHGLKVEVSVMPNGIAVHCSTSYPGSTADIRIFRLNMSFHQSCLRKLDGVQERMVDDGPLRDTFPDSWAVLVDKGYVGLASKIRAIHPMKKPPRGILEVHQKRENDRISHDRIIVENFFGRLCSLWAIGADRYRWSRKFYPVMFRSLVALTNFSIMCRPLRAEDTIARRTYAQRLYALGVEHARRTRDAQRRYQQVVDIRTELGRNTLPGNSGIDERGEEDEDMSQCDGYYDQIEEAFASDGDAETVYGDESPSDQP